MARPAPRSRTLSAVRLVAALGLPAAATLLPLGGCASGHGEYTTEGIKRGQQRVAEMKSAQEWDMARQSFLAGDLDKALAAVDRSISINPDVPKSHLLRGRILLEKGQLDPAMQALRRAEELDPALHEAPYYQGIVFERFTQKDKALERFQKAAELAPTNAQYVVAAAEMMMDLGQLDAAERFLNDRRDAFEHNAGVRQTLGHIAMIKGDPATAVEMFNEARLLAPDDSAILGDLLRAQIAVGRFAEAEYNIDKLMKMPGNADRRDLRHMRAKCLAAVDRPVEARAVLIELTSDAAGAKDVEAWIELGKVACVLRDMNRLRLASSRVIALAPSRHEGYMLKAIWQRRQNDPKGALQSINKAAANSPTDVSVLTLRGLILRDLGRQAEAKASFRAALAQNPHGESAELLNSLVAGGASAAVTE